MPNTLEKIRPTIFLFGHLKLDNSDLKLCASVPLGKMEVIISQQCCEKNSLIFMEN